MDNQLIERIVAEIEKRIKKPVLLVLTRRRDIVMKSINALAIFPLYGLLFLLPHRHSNAMIYRSGAM